jgi:hypothetical protein
MPRKAKPKEKTVEELEKEVKELQEKLAQKETPKEESKEEFDVLIPKSYRDAVREILNQKFTPSIQYSQDAPTFQFTVLVPREYSNASGAHWAMYKEDRRARVINNSDGPQGVKQWLELVYNNLEPEVRARIVAERT